MDLRALCTELVASFDASTLADAHKREPTLTQYASFAAALAPWLVEQEPADEQYPFMRAIVREYQRGVSTTWAGVLIVTMYPMMSALRRKAKAPASMADEIDEMIVEALLSEASRLNADSPTMVAVLTRAVERATFRAIRRGRKVSRAERICRREFAEMSTPDLALAVDLVRTPSNVVPLRTRERLKKQRSRERARARATFTLAA